MTPQEECINRAFDSLHQSLPLRLRGLVSEHIFSTDGGPNGIAWIDSLSAQLVLNHKSHVAVFFKGTLSNNPTDLEDGEYILQEYLNLTSNTSCQQQRYNNCGRGKEREDASGDSEEATESTSLNQFQTLQGSYAFIIYDKRGEGRVVASRDSQGLESLCWGISSSLTTSTTSLHTTLFFASDTALLEGECTDIQDFPPGLVFVSDHGSFPSTALRKMVDMGLIAMPKGFAVGSFAGKTDMLAAESNNNLLGLLAGAGDSGCKDKS